MLNASLQGAKNVWRLGGQTIRLEAAAASNDPNNSPGEALNWLAED